MGCHISVFQFNPVKRTADLSDNDFDNPFSSIEQFLLPLEKEFQVLQSFTAL